MSSSSNKPGGSTAYRGERTVVHLLRHGEVHNPSGVLYGRLPDFHLSARGIEMAERAAAWFADRKLTHLRCSPLERAQETMAPIAASRPELAITIDPRVIEAANSFEGQVFSGEASALADPRNWVKLRNPLKPSWGEPYDKIVARMRVAIADAAAAAEGGEALIVSHQLPIWMARLNASGRRILAHDPRRRECRLASVTSLTLDGGEVLDITYAEPAAELYPSDRQPSKRFVAGA